MNYHRGLFWAPLLFSMCINEFCNATRFSQAFHFAGYTCVLNIQSELPKTNKSLKKDSKELLFWLNANKIWLYFPKLKTNPMIQSWELNFICRKILNRSNYVKYLEIKIDENLNWKILIHDFASKLNRGSFHANLTNFS